MIKAFISKVSTEIDNEPDLKKILEQSSVDREGTIFQQIEQKLYLHESMNPDMWKDPMLFYGHVGILLTDDNKQVLTGEKRIFFITSLTMQITLGPIRDINGHQGIRLVWEKSKCT